MIKTISKAKMMQLAAAATLSPEVLGIDRDASNRILEAISNAVTQEVGGDIGRVFSGDFLLACGGNGVAHPMKQEPVGNRKGVPPTASPEAVGILIL